MSEVGLKDVAVRAGVSLSTASRVARGAGLVSDETRARVNSAMEELGYYPNLSARGLRSSRPGVIGVFLPYFSNSYWSRVAQGVERACSASNYTPIMCDRSVKDFQWLDGVSSGHTALLLNDLVEGLVTTWSWLGSDALSILRQRHIPIVLVDEPGPVVEQPCVLADNEGGGRLAASHLLMRGHTRPAIIGSSSATPTRERCEGYKSELAKCGRQMTSDHEYMRMIGGREDGYHAIIELMTARDRPDSIFATSIDLFSGAYLAIRSLGLAMPDDVALIGFDEPDWRDYAAVYPTYIAQPEGEIGRTAVNMLLKLLATDPAHQAELSGSGASVRLPTTLVQGQTT